jgi:hypothetical protein
VGFVVRFGDNAKPCPVAQSGRLDQRADNRFNWCIKCARVGESFCDFARAGVRKYGHCEFNGFDCCACCSVGAKLQRCGERASVDKRLGILVRFGGYIRPTD